MDGAGIFNFTIKRVPALIRDALAQSGCSVEQIDGFVFHQSNRFIMKHLMKKAALPEAKVPMITSDPLNDAWKLRAGVSTLKSYQIFDLAINGAAQN